MKQILFNTENVKAILEGRKTVTRRIIKPQPVAKLFPMPRSSCWPEHFANSEEMRIYRPPYQVGDILWVRETFTVAPDGSYVYKASVECPDVWKGTWKSPYCMPREAARIFLRVTGVRVERLQEITEDGAKAEGVAKSYPYTDPETGETVFVLDKDGTYRSGFSRAWDSTIPKHPNKFKRYPFYWDDNPWVWVIEFERISREEATHDE